jgi:hypothetical protein
MTKTHEERLPDIAATGGGEPAGGERRTGVRNRAVYRVAPVSTPHDSGLGRLRNISDRGMALDLAFPVCLGDAVTVALSEDVLLTGRVVWTAAADCGVRFDEPIDSVAALRRAADYACGPRGRPPRLLLGRTALASGECGLRAVEVCDISQRGMKIAHDRGFTPGLRVKVALGSGIERRGVVRWAKDDFAGLILTEPFSARDLGSIRAL